jgi:hypothetical protein
MVEVFTLVFVMSLRELSVDCDCMLNVRQGKVAVSNSGTLFARRGAVVRPSAARDVWPKFFSIDALLESDLSTGLGVYKSGFSAWPRNLLIKCVDTQYIYKVYVAKT